jgi:hypothetical protein
MAVLPSQGHRAPSSTSVILHQMLQQGWYLLDQTDLVWKSSLDQPLILQLTLIRQFLHPARHKDLPLARDLPVFELLRATQVFDGLELHETVVDGVGAVEVEWLIEADGRIGDDTCGEPCASAFIFI